MTPTGLSEENRALVERVFPGWVLSDGSWPIGTGGLNRLLDAARAEGPAPTYCVNHPDRRTRINLDGDNLCQECADAWVRGERDTAFEEGADRG